ncbi:hypothetical protein MVEN_00317800 [Mycena venus]|uniref:DUF6532 domain-containing protein n=1 Tax=Mycena venus TaxID=2733690 RepID=A0A8H7D6W1_9AGAR|nr:hypothetical protein MVEN_00317800 [Mycena venus]
MAGQSTLRHSTAAVQPRNDAANKENEHSSRNNGGRAATTRKSQPRTRIESDDEDADEDLRLGAEQPMGDDTEEDDDDASPVRGRTRRVSEKKAQLEEERVQAAARKQEKAVKAAKAAKKKAGVVEEDTRGPIRDDFFTSRTVPSTRPTATKIFAQRNSKVPPPPKFPSDDWHASSGSTAHRRDRHSHDDDDDSHPRARHDSSPEGPRQLFRGRSPAPNRVPAREPIRDINGGIVPDSVTLHLHHDSPRGHQQSSRRRPRSPSSPLRSSPRLRSASPNAGDKRHRSSSVDSDDLRSTQSRRTTHSGGRPRAKDLDDNDKECAFVAMDIYRCLISTEQAFPDSATEMTMVRRAWDGACEEVGERLPLTPAIAKLISNRGSQLRGELKTKIRPLVELMYGFKSGQNKKTIAFNRKLAEDLKEGSTFAFKDVVAKTGLYKHPILQSAVNIMWFANRRDEGPRRPEFFGPMLAARSLAVVLAVVENNIDERLTGIRTDVPFTANDYRSVYEGHVTSLEEFVTHTDKYQLLDKILKRMHTVGRFHSGAQPLGAANTSTFSKQVLDAALKEYEEGVTTDDTSDAEQ